MADLSLVDIRKNFGAVEVIKGTSFDIPEGEFVSLVGPSGCGKTTLLRMIAGLEAVTSGEIRIDGRLVNDIKPKDRDVAMVFQNYALYPHMNVAENIGFSLRMRRVAPAMIAKSVEKAAEMLGLKGLLSRFPRELSGGQRQRVAMGRALVREPKIFLFDEPLSNLDAQLRVQLRVELKELRQRLGITSVYVTHDQIEAMTLSDRIVVLNEGRISQIGAPLELYDRPQNMFVARFIGSPSMNFFDAVVDEEDGRVLARIGGAHSIPLAGRLSGSEKGRPITIGVRPEHLRLGSGHGGLPARIDVVEPTGFMTLIYASLGNESLCVVTTERPAIARGEMVSLSADAEKIHIFDSATGEAIDAAGN